mmetsp:Transcript_49857/g.69207  ORF Transcript_49857/g.69207 Transcript_49857/m.69207 type:complete len:204 (-) Transcript_49857:851-1462(-)
MLFLRLSKISLPSSMPLTMDAKLSSSRIMSAASWLTSEPVMPMAMPMSACLRAGESLTPSPVTATMSPLRWKPSTMRSFCWGDVRAKTICSNLMMASSWSSVMSRSWSPLITTALQSSELMSHGCLPCSSASVSAVGTSRMMPTCWAMALAVMGWSPVTITTLMCASVQVCTASGTAARGGSISAVRPRKVMPSSGKLGSSTL